MYACIPNFYFCSIIPTLQKEYNRSHKKFNINTLGYTLNTTRRQRYILSSVKVPHVFIFR